MSKARHHVKPLILMDFKSKRLFCVLWYSYIPMKQIQEWLSHSDFSTTANVYAHLDYNSMSSADAMAKGLSGALGVIS